MKKVIQILALTFFVVCLFPMFQTCDDDTIIKYRFPEEQIVDSSLSVQEIKKINDSLKVIAHKKQLLNLDKIREDYTVNGYELAFSGFKEFNLDDLNDSSFYSMLLFSFAIILSIVISLLAFKNKISAVFKLSILNLILVVSAMSITIFKLGIEWIEQIRYGYYILLINIVLLILLSWQYLKKTSANNQIQ